MQLDDKLPVYTIGIAAKLLDVHPRTLRIYEEEGLVKPHRQGGKRLYCQNDLNWIRCIRHLIHVENISIPGLKKLFNYLPCWKLKECPEEIRDNCEAYQQREKPCWEYAKSLCEKSCEECEIFLKKQEIKT